MLLKELLPTLRLKVINIGHRTHDATWRYRDVNSPFSRLYMITAGEAFVRHHDREYRLATGAMHLIPCFTLSDYYAKGEFQLFYIHFISRVAGGMDLFNLCEYDYQVETGPEMLDLFQQLVSLLPNRTIDVCRPYDEVQNREFLKKLDRDDFEGTPEVFLESDGIFRQILSPVVRTARDTGEHSPKRFAKVLEFITRNLDRPLSLVDLAGVACLQPTYFSDSFHRVFGVRPTEYVNRKRVEKAQLLLLSGGYTMKEIASLVGIQDAAYFSRLFKRYSGVSPTQYAKQSSALEQIHADEIATS